MKIKEHGERFLFLFVCLLVGMMTIELQDYIQTPLKINRFDSLNYATRVGLWTVGASSRRIINKHGYVLSPWASGGFVHGYTVSCSI